MAECESQHDSNDESFRHDFVFNDCNGGNHLKIWKAKQPFPIRK